MDHRLHRVEDTQQHNDPDYSRLGWLALGATIGGAVMYLTISELDKTGDKELGGMLKVLNKLKDVYPEKTSAMIDAVNTMEGINGSFAQQENKIVFLQRL